MWRKEKCLANRKCKSIFFKQSINHKKISKKGQNRSTRFPLLLDPGRELDVLNLKMENISLFIQSITWIVKQQNVMINTDD